MEYKKMNKICVLVSAILTIIAVILLIPTIQIYWFLILIAFGLFVMFDVVISIVALFFGDGKL